MTEPTWQVALRREEGVFVLFQAKEQVIIPVAEISILMANLAMLTSEGGLCHCGHEVVNHVQYCPEEDCQCTDGQFPEVNELGKQALELLLKGAVIAGSSGSREWDHRAWQDEARVFVSAAHGLPPND